MVKHLDVKVVATDNIQSLSGSNKIYCELVLIHAEHNQEIPNEKFKSDILVVQGSEECRFDFQQTMGLHYEFQHIELVKLKIMVWLNGMFKNKFLGGVEIELQDSASFQDEPQNLVLLDEDGKFAGDLKVKYGWTSDEEAKEGDQLENSYGFPFPTDTEKEPNELHVLVLGAEDLIAADLGFAGGSSDPFVVLKCAGEKCQTSRKTNELNPVWNEYFKFEIDDDSEYLEATVYDFDKGRIDEFLGKTIIPLDLGLADQEQKRFKNALGPKSTGKYDGTNRGTLELLVQWVHNPNVTIEQGLMSRMKNKMFGDDDSDDEEKEDEDDESDQEDKRTEEEKKKDEEDRLAALKKLESELEDIEVKSGDYTVTVQIIEARDLKGEDVTGMSDPVVYVEVLGEKLATRVEKSTLNPVFDETFVVQKRNLDKEEFENGQIIVKVMDADTLKKNDMIGSYTFDATFVYSQKDHEIYHKWVALTDNEDAKDNGIQGYLKLSVIITGPGDKMKRHDEEKEREEERKEEEEAGGIAKLVLMPSSQKQETKWFVTRIFKCQYLPQLDTGAAGIRKGGVDAFFQVSVNGSKPARTKVKKLKGERNTLNPTFNNELWVPIQVPNFGAKACYSVWDWDSLSPNELIAMCYTTFKEVNSYENRTKRKHWVNLYGAPIVDQISSPETKRHIELANKYPEHGTTYRGRVLLEQRIEDNLPEGYEDTVPFRLKKKIPRKAVSRSVHFQNYVIRALVISGTEIPKFTALTSLSKYKKMGLKISCGEYEEFTKLVDNADGMCSWNQFICMDNMEFPKDAEQIPDVFIYLVNGSGSSAEAVSYCRIKATELLNYGFKQGSREGPMCRWYRLKEDKCLNLLSKEEFPGSVLVQLGMGPKDAEDVNGADAINAEWKGELEKAGQGVRHQLRIHLYQAENLPSTDVNGLMDPYVKVKFQEKTKKSKICRKTVNPLWYETLCFDDCTLPRDREYLPQVTLHLYDFDTVKDEYCGCIQFPLSKAYNMNNSSRDLDPDPSIPQWHSLMFEEEGDTVGKILCSFELVECGDGQQLQPPKPIEPETRPAFVEITALGIRDLEPYLMVPMQLPFLTFEITCKKEKYKASTDPSKRPTAPNANFLQRIVFPVELPVDPMFTPKLKLRLYDTRLGGFHKPLVGAGSVDLRRKVPWSEDYEEPQSQMYTQRDEMKSVSAPYLGPDEDETKDEEKVEENENQSKPKKKKEVDKGVGISIADVGTYSPLHSETLDSQQDEVESDEEEEEEEVAYMKGREVLDCDLEEHLKTTPFETYKLYRGGKNAGSQAKSVGVFKGLIRIIEKEDADPLVDLQTFMKPQNYRVRLYILEAKGLTPMDVGIMGRQGKSDPYVVVRLGKDEFNDSENHQEDTTDADLYKLIEFNTELPGTSRLEIQILDYDDIGYDDLIGKTVIDLEDRWFDSNWQILGEGNKEDPTKNPVTPRWATKPLELRQLYVPTSTAPQGQLQCWVDILKANEASIYQPDDVSLPPKMVFEVRVVIWKTKDCVSMEMVSNMNDMFAKVWIEGADKQETDTHWRAKNGKASFNWRLKFDVLLGHSTRAMKFPYMHIQLWDRDIVKWNDVIGEGMVDLGKHFKKAYRKKKPITLFGPKPQKSKKSTRSKQSERLYSDGQDYFEEEVTEDVEADEATEFISSVKTFTGLGDDDPINSTWLKLEKTDHNKGTKKQMGQVCYSVSIFPKDLAEKQPVGFGRSAPNANPYCPPPVGRLKFTLNPFSMGLQLFGPKACCAVTCCLICIILMVILIYCNPILNFLIAITF